MTAMYGTTQVPGAAMMTALISPPRPGTDFVPSPGPERASARRVDLLTCIDGAGIAAPRRLDLS
jgi:hypothetical protein